MGNSDGCKAFLKVMQGGVNAAFNLALVGSRNEKRNFDLRRAENTA
jgi:hypothetical protein